MNDRIFASISNVQTADNAKKIADNLSQYTHNLKNEFGTQDFWYGEAADSLNDSLFELDAETIKLQDKISSFLLAYIESELAQLEDSRSLNGSTAESFYGDQFGSFQSLQEAYPGYKDRMSGASEPSAGTSEPIPVTPIEPVKLTYVGEVPQANNDD